MLPIIRRYSSQIVYANKSTIFASIQDFERLIGKENVYEKESLRKQYSCDQSAHKPRIPELVISPTSVEQVAACLRICDEKRIPVIPWGTGTGVEGGTICLTPAIIIDLRKMDSITRVHLEDFDCSVQPGVTKDTLNNHLKNSGLWFPVDPGADASLCGMAATGASGTNAVRYGTMKQNVIALQIVLANGQIVETRGRGNRPPKTSAGLNLTELFVGSEGVLGVITETTLRLHARPNSYSIAVCAFESIQQAVDSVVQVRQTSIPIARIELLDEAQIDACNRYSKIDLPIKPHLFLEFHGNTDEEVEKQSRLVGEICSSNNALSFEFSTNPSEQKRLWKARNDAFWAAKALKIDSKALSTDVCVPISKLPEVILETRRDLQENRLLGPIVGHVGDGNFHVIIPCDEKNAEEMQRVEAFCERLAMRALKAGGTCTGEHGIGIGKKKFLVEEVGEPAINVMKSIKLALDPNWILNPGKVL
ncbi:unnamed protein product, partial [Mesorhabditis belari]|uniref:D-lactate dehydrogenase (cytochrome) n=1 Tax=Mesorhabditis belari TaxID=2138241 RepID=A0AAF3JCD2_9BILA